MAMNTDTEFQFYTRGQNRNFELFRNLFRLEHRYFNIDNFLPFQSTDRSNIFAFVMRTGRYSCRVYVYEP